MATLNWGLLGTGHITASVIPAFHQSVHNCLVGVASRSQERAEAFARAQNLARAYSSYEAMLADPAIDVVYISLPNTAHAEWTIKAAEAGKHVLCEKPLAVTPAEVDDIAATATKTGVVVTEAFMYRHHPQTLRVKELLDQGVIGELRLIRGSFTYPLHETNNIRLEPKLAGGSLWDVGCYPVSYACFLVGQEPERVIGLQTLSPQGVDETFAGLMLFANGVYAQFDCGFRAPYRTEVEIVGSEGTIRVPDGFKPGFGLDAGIIVQRGQQPGQRERLQVVDKHLYLGELDDMADAILDAKLPRISLADSRANIVTINALRESARLGCMITVA